jgi:hypothetical protein
MTEWEEEMGNLRTDEDVVDDEEVGSDWKGDHGECEGEEFVDYGSVMR